MASVNPYREPGMEKYWIPSNIESAVFGTRITDRFFEIAIGGDIGFLSGTLKHMLERDWVDRSFVDQHAEGFDHLAHQLSALEWNHLEAISGSTRDEMLEFMVQEATDPITRDTRVTLEPSRVPSVG